VVLVLVLPGVEVGVCCRSVMWGVDEEEEEEEEERQEEDGEDEDAEDGDDEDAEDGDDEDEKDAAAADAPWDAAPAFETACALVFAFPFSSAAKDSDGASQPDTVALPTPSAAVISASTCTVLPRPM
jgi:hypothetical protein